MGKPWKDPDTLRRLYWEEGMSLSDVGDELGCSLRTVANWMEKHDIPRRKSNKEKPPSLCHIRSGDRDYEGFAVREPDGTQVRVYHHRLLAVAEYGFDAVDGNHVHHINNIPWANWPSNLEVLSPSSHQSIPPFESRCDHDHDVAPVDARN